MVSYLYLIVNVHYNVFLSGQHWFETQKSIDLARLEQQRQQRLQNMACGLANSLLGMGTGAQPPVWSQLASMGVPTLLIVGELDHKLTEINRAMDARLPCSTLAVIGGAGHNTHLERPSEFASSVDAFLRRIAD